VKANHIKLPKIQYKLNHPLIGKNCRFNTWLEMVTHVVDVAENEAKNRLYSQLLTLATELSDEILDTFEELTEE